MAARDVPGQCNAHFEVGDDHGDNLCTMRCGRVVGHGGDHIDRWTYTGADDQAHEAEFRWAVAQKPWDAPSPCEGCPEVESCDGIGECTCPERLDVHARAQEE
jgi:hypothetical protein